MERRFSCYSTPPRTHVGPTCLPTTAFLIALPYSAPVRPKPPALTTKRVHATRLFGAVCQHPRPDQRCHLLSSLSTARAQPWSCPTSASHPSQPILSAIHGLSLSLPLTLLYSLPPPPTPAPISVCWSIPGRVASHVILPTHSSKQARCHYLACRFPPLPRRIRPLLRVPFLDILYAALGIHRVRTRAVFPRSLLLPSSS